MAVHNYCWGASCLAAALVWKVARYACALPLYTTESDGYVDGGTVCANLCDHALTRVQEFYHERKLSVPVRCVVSIGAGVFSPEQLGCVDVHEYLTFGTHWQNPTEAVERLRNVITLSMSAAVRMDYNTLVQPQASTQTASLHVIPLSSLHACQ